MRESNTVDGEVVLMMSLSPDQRKMLIDLNFVENDRKPGLWCCHTPEWNVYIDLRDVPKTYKFSAKVQGPASEGDTKLLRALLAWQPEQRRLC